MNNYHSTLWAKSLFSCLAGVTPHFMVIYHDLSQTNYSSADSDLDALHTHSAASFTTMDQHFTALSGLPFPGDPISKK